MCTGRRGSVPLTSVRIRRARLAPRRPFEDVMITDGRVTGVGLAAARTRADEVIDLDGRYLLPGLWDRHVHFEQWAQVRARLDLSGAGSAAAVARLVAASIASGPQPGDTPVVGYGFRDALWPDEPHRALLDEECAAVPAVLISADLHSAWLNTAALHRFGHDDHETGLLREDAAMQVIG